MSKALLAVTATSLTSVGLLSAGYFVGGMWNEGSYLVASGIALALPGVAGLVIAAWSEISAGRAYRRRLDEGRRYAERSDAEFRARKQDQKHIDALEQALAA